MTGARIRSGIKTTNHREEEVAKILKIGENLRIRMLKTPRIRKFRQIPASPPVVVVADVDAVVVGVKVLENLRIRIRKPLKILLVVVAVREVVVAVREVVVALHSQI